MWSVKNCDETNVIVLHQNSNMHSNYPALQQEAVQNKISFFDGYVI
jgi:hypothetical protein